VKVLFALFVFIPLVVGARSNGPRPPQGLDEVIASERAFAKAGSVKGKRDAFLEYFVDDVVLFPPGAPITIGTDDLRKEPESKANLFWEPTWADVSAAGDMGFTTGPWQFRPDGAGGEVAGFGYFATVWKRQADGAFKAVLDIGVGGAEAVPFAGGLQPKEPGSVANKMTPAALRDSLLTAERELAAAARAGTPDAYFAVTAEGSILHRAGSRPAVGAASIRDALAGMKVSYAWDAPAGAGVAASGDLGYTYGDGEARFDPSTNKPAQRLHYARFWKRHRDGRWKVALEVVNPGPK
jgi:ketosteroid isomerase-like protein